MIPKQLRNPEFRFCLIRKQSKAPYEKEWQKNGYKFFDIKLKNHVGNYGVIGGYGKLRILDIDDKELAKEFDKKLNTFSVKTGSGGRHYYFLSDYEVNHVLINELGEYRAKNYQCVGAGSTHPNGNKYEVFNDTDLITLDTKAVVSLLKPYNRNLTPKFNLTEELDKRLEGKKDTSRSALEYRRAIAEFRKGKSREEVFKLLNAYKKFADAPEQYQEMTLDKAESFVLEEQEQKKVVIEEPKEKDIEILKDNNLFEKIAVNELDKKIVGEIPTRKVIVLCGYGGRLVENAQTASFNLMINDDAGTGKDYTAGASLELLPKEKYIKKTRISPNVLNYWHNAEDEPDWTWDSKVLYLEDISENILNHDVFKVMCSSGSSATIVKDQKVIDLEVKGKPVMIITTATAIPNPELTRRFVIVNLDSSKNQTRDIMKRHSEFREKGIVPQINLDIKDAMKYLKRVKVRIPFAKKIDEHFPHQNVVMRTNYPRFLDFISASVALHQYQREQDEEGFYLATEQDYEIARECFLKVCSNKYMIALTINQKKILNVFEKYPELKGTYSKLHANYMNFISDNAVKTNLNILVSYGLLESFETENEQNRMVTMYSLPLGFKQNENVEIPEYCRITSKPSISSKPSNTSISSKPTPNNTNFEEVSKQSKQSKQKLGEKILHFNLPNEYLHLSPKEQERMKQILLKEEQEKENDIIRERMKKFREQQNE